MFKLNVSNMVRIEKVLSYVFDLGEVVDLFVTVYVVNDAT